MRFFKNLKNTQRMPQSSLGVNRSALSFICCSQSLNKPKTSEVERRMRKITALMKKALECCRTRTFALDGAKSEFLKVSSSEFINYTKCNKA